MARGHLGFLVRRLRRFAAVRPAGGPTDGRLLGQFVARRDEAAFAALVDRHGPMALALCRRLLPREQDAEDAFQAAFLVLARKADTIRNRDSVGGWLYEVAYRLALQARAGETRRRARERQVPAVPPPDPTAGLERQELRAVLDEELRRVPEKYRTPLVLCYLEGKTNEEAARELGCPPGSMSWRLARGRELLRRRLARRGLGSAAGAALAAEAAAAVPPALAAAAVRASLRFAANGALTGPASALAEELLRIMTVSRIKTILSLLLAAAALCGAAVLIRQAVAARPLDRDGPAPEDYRPGQAVVGPEDRRNERMDLFGDSLPPSALVRLGTVRLRHGAYVPSVSFSPDGKTVASAGVDNTLRLWDVATGKELRRLGGHYPWVACVAFAPDGKALASAGADGAVCAWDAATGKELWKAQAGDKGNVALAVAYTPDGRSVAAGGSFEGVRFYNAATGKEQRRLPGVNGPVSSLSFSADGKLLASGGQGPAARLWDATTGEEIRQFHGEGGSFVPRVALSPDGRLLATAGDHRDKTIRLWDAPAGKELRRLDGGQAAGAIAFAPDGKALATGSPKGDVILWDVATGKELRRLHGHYDWAHALAFSADGKVLASTGGGAVRLWDVEAGKELHPAAGHGGPVYALAFSPDGKTVATGGEDRTVRLWDAATGQEVRGFAGRPTWVGGVGFADGGKKLLVTASGDAPVLVWDAATGKELSRVGGRDGASGRVALSADGRLAATADSDHTVRVWDTAAGKELQTFKNRSLVAHAFAPDGKMLVLVDGGDLPPTAIRLVEPATGRNLYEPQPLPAELLGDTGNGSVELACLVVSPDGKTLAFAPRGRPTIILWETVTGKERGRLVRQGDDAAVSCLAFAPDGRHLASGGTGLDSAICLWDLTTGKLLHEVQGHQGYVTALAFSPDGKKLASASNDTTALIWDVGSLVRGGK